MVFVRQSLTVGQLQQIVPFWEISFHYTLKNQISCFSHKWLPCLQTSWRQRLEEGVQRPISYIRQLERKLAQLSTRFTTIIVQILINPFPPNDFIWRHETFSFIMSHPAMFLGDSLCASIKGGAGGGGWVHPKGANSMAASGLNFEQPLVGAG